MLRGTKSTCAVGSVIPSVVLTAEALASSKNVLAKVLMVVLAGKSKVLISASTSESINAPAAVTFAVSVTSADASIPSNLVWSAFVKFWSV